MPTANGLNYNGDGAVIDMPSACMPESEAESILDHNKTPDSRALYRLFDEYVGQHPDARVMSNGTATVNVANSRVIMWGQIDAATGPILQLDSIDGKMMIIATSDGQVIWKHAFSGVYLCSTLNPVANIDWWGK
jgi:hypothetical protein